jgi:hypothetical protein
MDLADVCVFINIFSKEKIELFRHKFLIDFVSTDNYYESPKYGSEIVFETEDFNKMWEHVLEKEGRQYSFYFENTNNLDYPQAIIQVNTDGSICLALGVIFEKEEFYYQTLKQIFDQDDCFISYSIALPSSK